MNIKKRKYNMLPIVAVYLFALVFIKIMVVNNFNYFYFVTGVSGLFILYRIKVLGGLKEFLNLNKDLKIFYYMIGIYVFYVLGLTIINEPAYIIYSTNIILPFLTTLFLIYDFANNEEVIEKISKLIFYIFLISAVLSIILFLCGYSKIDISFDHGIYLTPTEKYLLSDNEIRVVWLTSHKSRFALYCLMGIFFANYNRYFEKKMKIVTIILLYINLILTNSITSIAIGGVALLFILKDEIIRFFKKFKWIRIVAIILIPIIGVVSLLIISQKRNIFTLGSRLYIWQSATDQIISKPMGIVSMGNDFLMHNPNLDFQFTNGHNIFFNEMIERGIIGGIIFIIILLSLIYIYYKNRKIEYLIGNILFIAGACIDYTIANEMTYIFWFINAIWIAETIVYKNGKSRSIFSK